MTAAGNVQKQIDALRSLVLRKVQQIIDGVGKDDLNGLRVNIEVIALLVTAMRSLQEADSVCIETNPEEGVARILSGLKEISS